MSTEASLSVLIVDDNSKNLQVLADILRSQNYKVAMARDGAKALKFVNRMIPDLILLDIMMPETDGFEVCRRLKADEHTKDIPIIFISALISTEDKVKGFELGGVDYITKPFQREEVFARIKTHLELKRSKEEVKTAYEKLRKAYEELEVAARTDSLTRLSNRRDIIEKMKYEKNRSARSGKPFSLILSDIDDFKKFNDQYGHDCGDFVLTAAAELIRSRVRKQDHVARWGGEEFLMLLPETGLDGGLVLAEAIRKALSEKIFEYNAEKLKITMTFGVSAYTTAMTIDQCIKYADESLYKGKKTGKDCIVLYDGTQPNRQ
jgi:diguanylate cyclase (GGDEF)-like protein